MSHLLIDERPLVILPSLAAKIGLNQAVFIQQLHYLTQFSPKSVEKNGLKWVKCSAPQWAKEYFPFWSPRTVERVINDLKESGLIFVKKDVEGRSSERTNWYSMDSHSRVWGDDHDNLSGMTTTICRDDHDNLSGCYKEEKDLNTENTEKPFTRSSRVGGNGGESKSSAGTDPRHSQIVKLYQQLYSESNHCPLAEVPWTGREAKQLSRILADAPNYSVDVFLTCIRNRFLSDVNKADHPRLWMLNGRLSSYRNGPVDAYGKPMQSNLQLSHQHAVREPAGRSAADALREILGDESI